MIYDVNLINDNQWEPRRFPEKTPMSVAITRNGMSARSFGQNKVRMTYHTLDDGVKSGSVTVRIRTSGKGRCNVANSEPLDAEKGLAEWEENQVIGGGDDNVYLVLYNDADNWFLSWIPEDELENTDIRIACVKQPQLHQLWKSDIQPALIGKTHFFEVSAVQHNEGTVRVQFHHDYLVDFNTWVADGQTIQYCVCDGVAGVIRRLLPTLNGTPLNRIPSANPHIDITSSTYFYIQVDRQAQWVTSGSIPFYGHAEDQISNPTIISSSSDIGDPYSSSNSTSTSFKIPLAYVEVFDGKLSKVQMLTDLKTNVSTVLVVGYLGGYIPDQWESSYNSSTNEYDWTHTQEGQITEPFTFNVGERKLPTQLTLPYYQD